MKSSHRPLLGLLVLVTLVLTTLAACDADPAGLGAAGRTGATAADAAFEPLRLERPAAGAHSLLGQRKPKQADVATSRAGEVGTRFEVTEAGRITAIRFFKGPGNTGVHRGTLWAEDGDALASVTFRKESRTGWQTARLKRPVTVLPGNRYTVSYFAPRGHWSMTGNGFSKIRRSGPIVTPRKAGRISTTHRMPTKDVGVRNLFVDVVWKPGADTTDDNAALDLPRIAWEGGSAYWAQFPQAKAGGWAKDTFFPIVVWYDGISSDEEVVYDKSVGINSYIGMDPNTDFGLFEKNNVFWIGDQLKNAKPGSKNWVGDFLDDEVDGRFPPAEGRAHLQALVDARAGNGRFKYANFTQIVMSTDGNEKDHEAYVNNYTDAVSIDMYWYTVPYCDDIYRDNYLTSVSRANCRTSSSYGKTMESLRKRDAADGKLQSPWQFIDLLNGGPGGGEFTANITPDQLKGAVMSSVINEARGIVYFNQSLSGPCQSANIIRESQVTPNFCGKANVAAATQVDALLRQLAPVINTQSWQWDAGAGLDSMLKTYGNDAYLFSMIDGSSTAGGRRLTLPPDVKGRTVEVVGEGRTIPVSATGTFTDTFAAESSFHIYRVPVS